MEFSYRPRLKLRVNKYFFYSADIKHICTHEHAINLTTVDKVDNVQTKSTCEYQNIKIQFS